MGRRRELAVRPAEGASLAAAVTEPKSELERRVQELQNTVLKEDTVQALEGFSEDDLLDIYQDLLALPASSDVAAPAEKQGSQVADDTATVRAVEQRLFGTGAPADVDIATSGVKSSLSAALLQRRATSLVPEGTVGEDVAPVPSSSADTGLGEGQDYKRVLARLHGIIAKVQDAQLRAASGPVQDVLPVSIIADQEWGSLVRVCMREEDAAAAELAVDLMKRSGASVSEESINHVLAFYAERGDVPRAETFMANALGGTLSILLIKSFTPNVSSSVTNRNPARSPCQSPFTRCCTQDHP